MRGKGKLQRGLQSGSYVGGCHRALRTVLRRIRRRVGKFTSRFFKVLSAGKIGMRSLGGNSQNVTDCFGGLRSNGLSSDIHGMAIRGYLSYPSR